MRLKTLLLSGVLGCLVLSHASAQSTIAERPLDLTFGKAFWGSLMPSYNLGDDGKGGSAFQDDLDSIGALWELKAVRRVLSTRTSFEARAFYGLSWSNQSRDQSDITLKSPIDGTNNNWTGGQASLASSLDHYGFDLAIRDTWRTEYGGLSAGLMFSYMAFDQEFEAEYSRNRLFNETLDSDFLGGKAFVGWEGFCLGQASSVDLLFGFYDLEADYEIEGRALAGTYSTDLSDQAGTIELRCTTWSQIGNFYTGITLGGMYITDMPTINHNLDGPATLGTDDAATLTAMVTILL